MRHVTAPFDGFETVPALEAYLAKVDPHFEQRPPTLFPIRYLRYWFTRYLLSRLFLHLNRPISVLEAGVGPGKLLCFMGGRKTAPGRYALPDWIARWDALDVQIDPRALARFSYSSFIKADIEMPWELVEKRYDAIVMLHVLEHLKDPEKAMGHALPAINQNGVLIGGSPTMPDVLANIHQRQLRRKNADRLDDVFLHKHLSVITPRRIRRFAASEGLSLDFLTGAFFLRATGSLLENHAWWLRANLGWGALFPALGGEVYFALRKPRALRSQE